MKSKVLILTTFLLISINGCIFRSLNPLFYDTDTINNPDLTGSWVSADGKTKWYFERVQDKDSALILQQVNQISETDASSLTGSHIYYDTSHFKITLGRIGKDHYFDLLPLRLDIKEISENKGHILDYYFVPTHSFTRIKIFKDRLIVQEFDYDVFRKYVREKKIKAEVAEYQTGERDGKPYYDFVLTGKTKELQEFILNYSKMPDVFRSEDTLYQVKGNY